MILNLSRFFEIFFKFSCIFDGRFFICRDRLCDGDSGSQVADIAGGFFKICTLSSIYTANQLVAWSFARMRITTSSIRRGLWAAATAACTGTAAWADWALLQTDRP